MGYMRHHAIIVTANEQNMLVLRKKVLAVIMGQPDNDDVYLDLPVSDLLPSQVNGYVSFLIGPDGSQEGWAASARGNQLRRGIIDVLKGSWASWAEVQYGDEDGWDMVLRTNAKPVLEGD